MSKQQLYINDIAVDMPTEEIKIKVASNILADADKVMTAHSYNIALPRTMNNDNIFALAYAPTADTGGKTTHTYLKASLHVDGVPLFDTGQAVLTSVDEKGYNLNLFWGVIGAFDEIKREGLKLNELPLSTHWTEQQGDWLTLTRNVHEGLSVGDPYNSGMNTAVYNTLDSDSQSEATRLPWWMPTNSATTILAIIGRIYGITFDISPLAQSRIAKLNHIATTLNIIAKGEQIMFSCTSQLRQITTDRYYINWNNTINPLPCQEAYNGTIRYDNAYYGGTYLAKRNLRVKSVKVWGARDRNDYRIIFPSSPDVQVEPTYNPSTGYYEVDYTWYNTQMDDGEVLPAIQVATDGVPAGNFTQLYMSVAIDEVAEGEVGYPWSYVRNAPELKILDYISEILAHTGSVIVGSVTHTDKVKIVTFDEIVGKSAIGYDMQGLKNIEMILDDLAQKNIYIHKDNDDDEAQGLPVYTAEGVIYTNDATLKDERDAYKSDFKVPRTNKLLHWKVEKNENASTYKATWQNAGNNIEGMDFATFTYLNTGQDFAQTIADYYTNYEVVANRPKTIDVMVKLSVLELLAFDFTRPVYINQLGRSYLVESIESDNSDIYKLKLIQI